MLQKFIIFNRVKIWDAYAEVPRVLNLVAVKCFNREERKGMSFKEYKILQQIALQSLIIMEKNFKLSI